MTWILVFFIIKHFICDFILQFPRHYLNKGTYGRWGGIEHSLIHGIATISLLGPMAGLIDFVVHYHIDWGKMKLNKKMNWKPDNSEYFWWMIGFDQMLHYLTYIILIYFFY